MNKTLKKANKDLTKIIEKNILRRVEEYVIPIIKEMITNDYNMMLNGRVTDRNSRTNPEDYMDEFVDRLDEFEYIVKTDTGIRVCVPDIENFDFSGRLRVIQDILEGTTGAYVEVDIEQLEDIYGKRPITVEYVDASIPMKERIVKLRKTADVIKRLKANDIKIVDYPFSNTPPIDIFATTNEYVEKELINAIIDESLVVSNKEFAKTFRA